MADTTKIEWCDATWNPVTGCSKVSTGCKHCFAERLFPRVYGSSQVEDAKTGEIRPRKFTDVACHDDRLGMPLRWRKPRMIFVNSMSDLFHDEVPDEFIDEVFAVMALAPRHIFQVLTKRPKRMRDYVTAPFAANRILSAMQRVAPDGVWSWPTWDEAFRNVWLGVSVENQKTADERIPLLLRTPAAVRWVSYEPALGPVDMRPWLRLSKFKEDYAQLVARSGGEDSIPEHLRWNGKEPPSLHWIVCGGESGPGARPMHPDWARSIRDDCVAAGVPYFFKQWGAWHKTTARHGTHWITVLGETRPRLGTPLKDIPGVLIQNVGKKAAGRELDGRTWDEMPQ